MCLWAFCTKKHCFFDGFGRKIGYLPLPPPTLPPSPSPCLLTSPPCLPSLPPVSPSFASPVPSTHSHPRLPTHPSPHPPATKTHSTHPHYHAQNRCKPRITNLLTHTFTPQAFRAPIPQNTSEMTPICSTSTTSQIFTAPAQPHVPSTQLLSFPVNYAAQTCAAPAQTLGSPMSYAAPPQTVSSPMNYACQTYATPAQTVGSPMSYTAPSYAVPAHTLRSPMPCLGHGSAANPSMITFPVQQMAYAAPVIMNCAPTVQSMSYLPHPMDPMPQVPVQNMRYVRPPPMPTLPSAPMPQTKPQSMPMQSVAVQAMPAQSKTTGTSTAVKMPPQQFSPPVSPAQSMSYAHVSAAQNMSFAQPMMQQTSSMMTVPMTNFKPVAPPPQQTYTEVPSFQTCAPQAPLTSASVPAPPPNDYDDLHGGGSTATQSEQPPVTTQISTAAPSGHPATPNAGAVGAASCLFVWEALFFRGCHPLAVGTLCGHVMFLGPGVPYYTGCATSCLAWDTRTDCDSLVCPVVCRCVWCPGIC